MKSKSKDDVYKYKKWHNLILKLQKRCKKYFLTILEQKITPNHIGQLLSHISPIIMQKAMHIFSLLKIMKLYLIIVK